MSGHPKISKQPSLYPPTVFHLIRILQFISSAVVLSILSFFVHFLHVEYIYVPWTFILLLVVSTLTICSLAFTAYLHYARRLPPKINLSQNVFNAVLWALAFVLLTWNIRPTLANRCTYESWRSEGGIMICRMYKALTAFTITGLLSTAASVYLDLRTHRISTNRGAYNSMQEPKHNAFVKSQQGLHGTSQQDPYNTRTASHEISKPYKLQRPIEVQHFGYSVPSEQTTYDGPSGTHII